MPRALALALRLLGLRRRPPVTRWGRSLRRAERVFTVVAVAYLGLQAFPQVLFAESLTASGITVYARHPLPPATATRLAEARRLVEAAELAAPGRTERVFVCDSPWVFRLFAPLYGGAFAVSMPVTDHIFIDSADWEADQARTARRDYPTRPLAGTIAHEITHGLIRRRLGLVRAARLPEWIAEGYPEFVAGSGSFPTEQGERLLVAGRTDPSAAFHYYRARAMVTHLIRDEQATFAQVVARAGDEAAVLARTRQAIAERSARP